MKLIGFGYKMGVGKDAAAQVLVRDHGFHKLAFGDGVKLAAQAIFGFHDDQLWGDGKGVLAPELGVTPGRVLQLLGDGVREWIDRDAWVRRVARCVDRAPSWHPGFVISDVRHESEALMILKRGGRVYRIDRELPNVLPAMEGRDTRHRSEVELDSFKHWTGVIDNNGSLVDLREQVRMLVRRA